ncbi:MAG: hypothetical protein WC523_02945 [Patescibacteria group bacterium]
MNERNYIDKIKFKLFLNRELSLLATSVAILGYTKGLKRVINFSFQNICYLSNGETTSSLRNEDELKKYGYAISKIIKKNRLKCNRLLNRGLKLNNFVHNLLKLKKDYRGYSDQALYNEASRLLDLFIKLFIFSTIIPFEMSSVFNDLKNKNGIKNYFNLEKKSIN